MMSLHDCGGIVMTYIMPFFCWLKDQILMVEDYAYVGTDFCGDTYLVLLEGEHDLGKKYSTKHYIYIYIL